MIWEVLWVLLSLCDKFELLLVFLLFPVNAEILHNVDSEVRFHPLQIFFQILIFCKLKLKCICILFCHSSTAISWHHSVMRNLYTDLNTKKLKCLYLVSIRPLWCATANWAHVHPIPLWFITLGLDYTHWSSIGCSTMKTKELSVEFHERILRHRSGEGYTIYFIACWQFPWAQLLPYSIDWGVGGYSESLLDISFYIFIHFWCTIKIFLPL